MRRPDAIVISVGLWHMLHIHDVKGYQDQLRFLRSVISNLTANPSAESAEVERHPLVAFWSTQPPVACPLIGLLDM